MYGKVNGGYGTVTSTFGAVANFTCDNGFYLSGLEKKECGSNGVWSAGVNATCTKKGLFVKMVLMKVTE